jgi:hypothetical protein
MGASKQYPICWCKKKKKKKPVWYHILPQFRNIKISRIHFWWKHGDEDAVILNFNGSALMNPEKAGNVCLIRKHHDNF